MLRPYFMPRFLCLHAAYRGEVQPPELGLGKQGTKESRMGDRTATPGAPLPVRGQGCPLSVSPAPRDKRDGDRVKLAFIPCSGVRDEDEDTYPRASSLFFILSLSSHPNSYSFPQIKCLSRRANSCLHMNSEGSGGLQTLAVRSRSPT